MLRPLLAAAFALAAPAFAQAPDMRFDTTTCHTWEGGLGAQGSYSKCAPHTVIVQGPTRVETRIERVEVPVPGPVVERPCITPPAVVRPPAKARAKPAQRCERWVPAR